ncbi:MAG TPA: DUF4443 domain-containing protein [Candidatus Acidoferrales bacterium]|nr:DUF4443 domain-containing protein [Candidatus Acidoferrales bacterium]
MPSQKVLQTIQSLSKISSPGPTPAYTTIHVLRTLLCIGDEGHIGRIELSRKLGLGEGTVRTIIRHLVKAKVVAIEKDGCTLNPRGATLYKTLKLKLSQPFRINARQLALDKTSAAILVKAAGDFVRRGIEQRDAAVRAGATGACTLIFRGGKLLMPMDEQEDWTLQPNELLYQDIEKTFTPKNNDVVMIVSAPSEDVAEQGVVAAALTLIE